MNKNGKLISCKVCGNEFYIPGSRIGFKKYCSRDCAKKDKWGFKSKTKNCIVCDVLFTISTNIELQKKTCSYECWRKNNYDISARRSKQIEERQCAQCEAKFIARKFGNRKLCQSCLNKKNSLNKIGKGNPNYKSGVFTHANFQGRKSKTAYKHLNECRRYKKEFIAEHGYQFCEVCGVNKNGTPRFEVHHLIFASQKPKHPNLHDNRNMIHICLSCHHKFHNGKEYSEVFLRIEKERGLKELFS